MSEGLDAATLEALRADLEAHRAGLRKEIADQGFAPDSDDFGLSLERGFADGGHATAERGQLLSLVEGLRSNLIDVERALAKMDRGNYGRCERCGELIMVERLEAIPWARLCIGCKQKAR